MTQITLSNDLNGTTVEADGETTYVTASGLLDSFTAVINGNCDFLAGDGTTLTDVRHVGDMDSCIITQLTPGDFFVTGMHLG